MKPVDPLVPVVWYPGHELLLPDIVRAEGAWIEAADGRRWLDLESGVWAAPCGHSHPRLLAALQDQFAAVAHSGFNWASPVTGRAVAAVLALLDLGEGSRGVLLCSGSEAVEYCLRVVTGMLPRPLMLTMADSYCGAYGLAHGRDPERWATFDWFPCADCTKDRTCDANCPRFAAIPFATVGAFVFEPGSSSGLVRFPPDKLVTAIAARVQADGGFVVVNEVTTGLGRTGPWFGFRHASLQPDLVALGKGLGGGYPVAMAAIGSRVAGRLAAPPAYAQSHQNDPLGAAMVLAVLEVFRREDLLARAAANAAHLVDGLRHLASATDRLSDVRARGSMIALDLAAGREAAARTHRALLAAGYLVGLRPGTPTLRLDPPFCLDPAAIDGFLAALAAALEA